MYLNIHEDIKISFKERREVLENLGFEKLSKNIFQKDNDVIILKSMVSTTNQYEKSSVSIKEKIYEKIKYKNITLEIYERNCYRSKEFLEIYEVPIFQLVPTSTYRSKKTKTMRYKVQTLKEVSLVVDCLIGVNNINFNELVS